MISRSYSSEERAPRPGVVSRPNGFFDFRQVVPHIASPKGRGHETSGTDPWGEYEHHGSWQAQRHTASLRNSPMGLKRNHLLFFVFVLVLMSLSTLMAKNDEQRGNWTPPIEPPGTVIVTTLSEGPSSRPPGGHPHRRSAAPKQPSPHGGRPPSTAATRLGQWQRGRAASGAAALEPSLERTSLDTVPEPLRQRL